MKKNRLSLFAVITLMLIIGSSFYPSEADSANLTVTKDTLQSSRISFAGRVKSPTTVGSNKVWLYTAGTTDFYSISTAGLRSGDLLAIGAGTYTISSILASDQFTLTSNLSGTDANDGTAIYLRTKPQHVITFDTASAIDGGFFRVLIPAATTNSNDGNPDSSGFDFNTTVDITPTDTTGYTFLTNTATASGGTNCPAGFHCFEFHYIGAGGVSTPITLTLGNTSGTNTMIAPAPASAHVQATADTYAFKVQNFPNAADPTGTPTDQTTGRIAVIESVRISATVDPTITFTIAGVVAGANPCGTGASNQTDIDTTTGTNAPLAVPFGSLALNTFKNAAQLLTVSTNAVNGYVVTAQENDQLGKDGGITPFIPDTSGDNGLATETVTDTWDVASGHSGFGYTLKSVAGATVPFTTTGASFNARRFPSVTDPDSPLVQTVMSNTTVADTDQANVCYRIAVNATQASGDYENQITYTATATF